MMLEICADSIQSACIAQECGAHRIELCTGLMEGGMTPSPAFIRKTREAVNIKLYILIRPRGGDFCYSDAEYAIMKEDIHYCGKNGCNGVVIGMLNANGSVDKARCSELVQIAHAYGMGVTFHRAFDRCKDLFLALEEIIEIGCERILTSGGCNTAIDGAAVIKQLIEKAGNRITIMPGAGITPDNAEYLISTTGLREMHGTFRSYEHGKMLYKNENFSQQEYEIGLADAEKIKKVVNLIRSF
jgi:copper homeostasis protein